MNEDTLAARHYLYRMFQCLLGGEPTADVLASIDAGLVREACDIVGARVPHALLTQCAEAAAHAEKLDALRAQHMRALVGPAKLASPPWESAQLSGDGALFSRITLDVRNAYRAQGLLPEAYPRVSDDHVALECAFLADVAQRAQETAEAGDVERERELLAASQRFLADHLGRWVSAFADNMDGEKTPFYALVACSLAEFVTRDQELLEVALPVAAEA